MSSTKDTSPDAEVPDLSTLNLSPVSPNSTTESARLTTTSFTALSPSKTPTKITATTSPNPPTPTKISATTTTPPSESTQDKPSAADSPTVKDKDKKKFSAAAEKKKAYHKRKNEFRKARLAEGLVSGLASAASSRAPSVAGDDDEEEGEIDLDEEILWAARMKKHGPYTATSSTGQKLTFSLCALRCFATPAIGMAAILTVANKLTDEQVKEWAGREERAGQVPSLHAPGTNRGAHNVDWYGGCSRIGVSQKADDAQRKLWEDATMTAEGWTVEMSVHDKLMAREEHCERFHGKMPRHGPFMTQARDKMGRTKGEMGFEICSGCWPNAQDGCNAFLAFHEALMKKGGQNLDAEEWAMKIQWFVFGEWRVREEVKKKCEREHRNTKLLGPFNVAGPQGEWFLVKLCGGCYKDGEEAMRALTENMMGERGRSLAKIRQQIQSIRGVRWVGEGRIVPGPRPGGPHLNAQQEISKCPHHVGDEVWGPCIAKGPDGKRFKLSFCRGCYATAQDGMQALVEEFERDWRASLGKQKERLSKLSGVQDVVAYYKGSENNIMGQTTME